MPTLIKLTFHAELLRPDDLLHLHADGSNLRLVSDDERGPVLTVEDRAQPAFLRFTFAPQTIAESAFFEAALVPGKNPPSQITPESNPNPTNPDQDQPKTIHDPLPEPGTISKSAQTAAAKKDPNKIPTAAQIGHPSRLVFLVPADAAIPFTFDGLLEWSNLELSVNGIAAIGDKPSADQIASAPAIREPATNETAIELPYQLAISPTRDVAWLHRLQPFTSRGRTELWHTRLALKTAGVITELSKDDPAPLRAIWSPDYDPNKLPDVQDDPELGRTAMCGNDRHQIVVLTSAFHGYEVKHTQRFRKRRPVMVYSPYVPEPFHADRLMLSSLGGWLRSHGQWEPPRRAQPVIMQRPDFGVIFKNVDILRLGAVNRAPVEQPIEIIDEPFLFFQRKPQQLDLSEWVHLATQGRDHYVKIVYEGELWPFRHPAALIKVTERKFKETNGIVGAYLMQRMFIVVRKPVRDFEEKDYGNPLKSVRLTTLVTPDIADPDIADPEHAKITGTVRSFWVEVMTGPAPLDRTKFPFHAVATDVEENKVDFTVPLMFVSRSDLDKTKPVVVAYNAKTEVNTRVCNIPGQKVAFAPKDPKKPTDTTQLITDSLNFIMDATRVQPTLLKAAVKIPQVQELLGTNQSTSIRLYPDYVAKGPDDPANTTGVFAQIVDAAYDEFTIANPTASLGVKIAAEKAGGMATPNMAVTTLSRALGPLAGKVADAVKNNFDPTQFFPKGEAMLFGSFDLLDLFLPKAGPPAPMSLDENAPKMRTEKSSDGKAIITSLDWKPKFLEPDKKFETPIASIYKNFGGVISVLDISGTITKPIDPGSLGDVDSDFKGSLNAFTVTILSSVSINFESFSFRKRSNEKADVKVKLDPARPLEFGGDLAFVEEIRNAIPPGLFGDGPSLDLIDNPLGIRAGFAFALPPLTVGVFTLKDVKLGAALTLPFLDGKPVFDFNISERPHPFLLAVGIFGGGGFFHLQLDTAGMKALEVSLEFGAAAALDIGVASGEVHIMAGIYFSLQRKEGSSDLAAILTGFLRLGGSLNVLGLISISVEFNLSFTYDGTRDKAYGRATLTVSVHVLFFSTSVELTVERAFGGSGDPHFIDFFPDPTPWEEYALAFA